LNGLARRNTPGVTYRNRMLLCRARRNSFDAAPLESVPLCTKLPGQKDNGRTCPAVQPRSGGLTG
ncbi:MAG: hypothetical protein ACR2NU_11320, partial [Aeoliella sp.]